MLNLYDYLKNNPKKYIIFDLDETLFFLHIDWNIFKQKFRWYMKSIDPEFEKRYPINWNIIDTVTKATKVYWKWALDISYKTSQEVELPNMKWFWINTEIINFIKNNNSDYRFYIWSSNMMDTIKYVLQKTNMEKYFEKIIDKSSVMFMKRNIEWFEKIYNPKYQKSDYLMVWDSKYDKLAAENAWIDFFKIENVKWEEFI